MGTSREDKKTGPGPFRYACIGYAGMERLVEEKKENEIKQVSELNFAHVWWGRGMRTNLVHYPISYRSCFHEGRGVVFTINGDK